MAPIAAQWVREPPSGGALALKHIAELPRLRALVADPKQYAVLLQGYKRCAEAARLQALIADPQAMQLLQTAGLQGTRLPSSSRHWQPCCRSTRGALKRWCYA
ncbi:MAG: hypothetical protein R3E67_05415 [Pseudomonadales bacterium]